MEELFLLSTFLTVNTGVRRMVLSLIVCVSYCQYWRLEPDGFKSLIVVFPTVNRGRIFLQTS